MELACISHDIGKAHVDWQEYIKGKKKRGPNHSATGAIFFAYLAYHWLKAHDLWDKLKWTWLTLLRDIADHHGSLKNANLNENMLEHADFNKMDMNGIAKWIGELIPFYKERGIRIDPETLDNWQADQLYDIAEVVYEDHIEEMYDHPASHHDMMQMLQRMRTITTILIASDRLDIFPISDQRLQGDVRQFEKQIDLYCLQGKDHPLAQVRKVAQHHILSQLEKSEGGRFFNLEMPTGYGKTVTALKLAVEFFKSRGMSKIVYVAPYLSILEQNAKEIGEALNTTTMEHHSMAILNDRLIEEKDDELRDEWLSLISQTWAHGIVCTSFVQFMKAIFPKRAQDTLRRAYLQKSVILIDEPQIIDAHVWNLFLIGLEALAEAYDGMIVFISATMPPFRYGLKQKPNRLYVSSTDKHSRYVVYQVEARDEIRCAMNLQEQTVPSSVAICNTIKDAIRVYQNLNSADDEQHFLLHGLMIPIHKSAQIERIRLALNQQKEGKNHSRIKVVSTQIIEAGANLSFHYMYRARAILPSLLQAAGRLNRHGELSQAVMETGPFIRNDIEMESRKFVYPAELCRITDELLSEKRHWHEHELEPLVNQYYERMFQQNSYEAILQDIEKAADGKWESISKHEVFKQENYRLPVFIPWDWYCYEKELQEKLSRSLKDFDIHSAHDMYRMFLQGDWKKWGFVKQKAFFQLFHLFVLQIPAKQALKLVSKEDFLHFKIPKLEDTEAYDSEKGLIAGMDEIEDFTI